MTTKHFDTFSSSMMSPEKAKNGDFCLIEYLDANQLLILLAADGVGSCPCDWKASQMSCELFLNHFKNNLRNQTIEQNINLSLDKTNEEILSLEGVCKGMKSTLSVVVWEIAEDLIYHVSIGDSRIYLYGNQELEQITQDESNALVMKGKDGKRILSSGSLMVREGITNAVGTPHLSFEIHSIHITNYQAIILATDGFYKATYSFDEDIKRALETFYLQGALANINTIYKDYQKDDATVVIARKKGFDIKNKEQILDLVMQNIDFKTHTLSKLLVSQIIFQEIEGCISSKSEEILLKLLIYCRTYQINFGRENRIIFLTKVAENKLQNPEIYRLLRIS
jgi:serine/threonine protein phosphatase PrpC